MDPSQIGLLVALFVLVLFSAYFSATEMSFSTVNKVRLRTLEADGNKSAARVLKLLEKYDRLLSTILIGNNIVNITAATLATVFFTRAIASHPDIAAVVSTIVMTVVVLIFGEITPKIIAKQYAEWFAMKTWGLMWFFSMILYPLELILTPLKMLIRKIFKSKKTEGITEDELITYVETAQNEGGIDEHEGKLIRSAIEFDDLDIDDIMVPRVNVIAVEENEQLDVIEELFVSTGFSRLPVYAKTIDSIIGVIHEKDFNTVYHSGQEDVNIKGIIQSSICVSPSMKISTALRMLQKAKIHIAIVVDEFGGTAGIVTLEDILEELVGEIWDEHDEVEILSRKINEDTFLVSASCNLEDMFEELGLNIREEFDSTTVGGWITEEMGRIAVVGDCVQLDNIDFTVTKANVKRVLEIKVKINPPLEDAEHSGIIKNIENVENLETLIDSQNIENIENINSVTNDENSQNSQNDASVSEETLKIDQNKEN